MNTLYKVRHVLRMCGENGSEVIPQHLSDWVISTDGFSLLFCCSLTLQIKRSVDTGRVSIKVKRQHKQIETQMCLRETSEQSLCSFVLCFAYCLFNALPHSHTDRLVFRKLCKYLYPVRSDHSTRINTHFYSAFNNLQLCGKGGIKCEFAFFSQGWGIL